MDDTLIDYNFGKHAIARHVYINDEEFKPIDYVLGWGQTEKDFADATDNDGNVWQINYNKSLAGDYTQTQKSNYIRTSFVNFSTTENQKASGDKRCYYPFCFGPVNDGTLNENLNLDGEYVDTLNKNAWPPLPRFYKDGKVARLVKYNESFKSTANINQADNSSPRFIGMQKYICPKHENAAWPHDYYVLTKQGGNNDTSAWPIRPSNGDGSNMVLTPGKPYYTRIRIPLADLMCKYVNPNDRTQFDNNIFSDEYSDESTVYTKNGSGNLIISKIKGHISLINPNGCNAVMGPDGTYTYPHAFNQIYYRLTTNEYGDYVYPTDEDPKNINIGDSGDGVVKTLCIYNSNCAGYAYGNKTNSILTSGVKNPPTGANNNSNYFGETINFEIPVFKDQKYLVFDIYTDIGDNEQYVSNSSTNWWNMVWSFDGCYFHRYTNATIYLPKVFIDVNPLLVYNTENKDFVYWNVKHYIGTRNVNISLIELDKTKLDINEGTQKVCDANFEIISKDEIRVVFRKTSNISADRFKIIITGYLLQGLS